MSRQLQPTNANILHRLVRRIFVSLSWLAAVLAVSALAVRLGMRYNALFSLRGPLAEGLLDGDSAAEKPRRRAPPPPP